MNILVFDIETVPDIESGKRLYDLAGLSDEAAVEFMCHQRRQETDGKSEFMRHYLHQIVAISVVLKTPEQLKVWSLGDAGADEKEILRRFFEGIERYSPTLVSWNGGGFDLPVLHYRALLHGVSAPRYWEHGDEDRGFRWNNYLSRFHHRHTDLGGPERRGRSRVYVPSAPPGNGRQVRVHAPLSASNRGHLGRAEDP